MSISAATITKLRQQNALTHAELGKIMGFNEQTVRYMELGLRPVPYKSYRALIKMLTHSDISHGRKQRPTIRRPNKIKDIPVLGFAQGGFEGNNITNQEPIDWTYRPSSLAQVSDAFAVFVTGDSMEPKYQAGDLVYVNPHTPPRIGQYVLVETREHRGYIKKFVKWCGDYLVLKQYNPKTELWIEKVNILHLMAIVDECRQ